MNPTGMPPTAFTRRSLLFNLILLLCLIVVYAGFQFSNLQKVRHNQIAVDGKIALSKHDTTRARERFDTFLRAYPTDYTGYVIVSSFCQEVDQPALALEYIQRGLDACKNAPKPELAELYAQQASALAMAEPAHPQTRAIAAARTALSLDPDNPMMKNAVGYMLADNDQNLDEAEKLLRQALAAFPEKGGDETTLSPRYLIEDSFGWLLYKKGDYPGAIAALNEAVQDLPSGTDGFTAKYYYYHLAAALRKAGKIDDARRTLAIALQYDPVFSEAKAEEALLPPANTPAASPPASAPPPTATQP